MAKVYPLKSGKYLNRNQSLINYQRQTDQSFKNTKARAENYQAVNEY